MDNNLTKREYWDARQERLNVQTPERCAKGNEWALKISKKLDFKSSPEDIKIIELGCNPGYSTLALLNYINAEASGVDYNIHDTSFIKNIVDNGKRFGKLFNADIRALNIDHKYDLVFSCGLIEHFIDFDVLIKKHTDLVNKSGYVLIVVPNFLKLQYLYHYIFDRYDLKQHNIKSMNVDLIAKIIEQEDFEIVDSGYCGYL